MRYAALLLLLCACSSLSTEQRDKLAFHQRNAKTYFDGGNYDQAAGQIERGLELAPDDYLLNSLKGSMLLRESESALGTEHRKLDAAAAVLSKVYETRAPNRHEPFLLMSYALVQQKQGRRHLGEALSLRDQATRAPNKKALQDQADAEQVQAATLLAEARDVLGVLLDRGELVRLAHYHRLLIAQDLHDETAFTSEANAYIAQLDKDKVLLQKQIDTTPNAAYEQIRTKDLRDLKAEEVAACDLLADHYYLAKDFDDALKMLDRVIALDPTRTADYYNRGRVHLELKNQELAAKDFRAFVINSKLPEDNPKMVFAFSALRQ